METSRRERKGFGRTPSLFMSQEHRSWSATTWQPQPQKYRPKMSVERIATTKKMKPALMSPSSRVCIDSLGSTGEMVEPVTTHCNMCAKIKRCTVMSTAARQRPMRECGLPFASASTGSETFRPAFVQLCDLVCSLIVKCSAPASWYTGHEHHRHFSPGSQTLASSSSHLS